VKRKWYVSFSSGPFAGLSSALRNETYSWQPQPDVNGEFSDSSRYKLVSTGKSSTPIGIAAFANMGTKFNYSLGLGISTGVGVSFINKIKPAYLAGLSLYVGDKQQLNLTLGAIFLPVEKLKKEIYPNIGTDLYAKKPSEIEFKNKLAKGFFLSISYTLYSFDRFRNSAFTSSR
jgi:hypothetical protein